VRLIAELPSIFKEPVEILPSMVSIGNSSLFSAIIFTQTSLCYVSSRAFKKTLSNKGLCN
jgi:hypothetical protein